MHIVYILFGGRYWWDSVNAIILIVSSANTNRRKKKDAKEVNIEIVSDTCLSINSKYNMLLYTVQWVRAYKHNTLILSRFNCCHFYFLITIIHIFLFLQLIFFTANASPFIVGSVWYGSFHLHFHSLIIAAYYLKNWELVSSVSCLSWIQCKNCH